MTHSHRVLFGFLLMAAIAAASAAAMAEEIDRLLAAVNGRVITESDLRLARDLNVLVALGASAPTLTLAAEVDRLVNREILRQELENFPLGPEKLKLRRLRSRLSPEAIARPWTTPGGAPLNSLQSRLDPRKKQLTAPAVVHGHPTQVPEPN